MAAADEEIELQFTVRFSMRSKVLVLCFAMFLVSCSGHSNSLDRAKAKKVIEASDSYQVKQQFIFITEDEYSRGESGGFWKNQVFAGLVLTDKGKQFFKSISGGYGPLKQARPITSFRPYVLEITGIGDGESPSIKIVEYKWNWQLDPLPGEIKVLFQDHPVQSGKATFQLYDDGWRIVKWEQQ